jgi:K+ transporter
VPQRPPIKPTLAALGALGVVFGDIGTSPLYALKQSFLAHDGRRLEVSPDRFGFMDVVDLPDILEHEGAEMTGLDLAHAQYVIGRETLRLPTRSTEARDRGMALWRERLFIRLVRNASTADVYFKLPPSRTIEMGVQVEL